MKALAIFGVLALVVHLAQGCALLGSATPAERAAQALDGVDAANRAAEVACDVYAAGVVARRVKADPQVTGRCNARILDRE
jgi:hypothetical protein